MATDPIPEPLEHQDLREDTKVEFTRPALPVASDVTPAAVDLRSAGDGSGGGKVEAIRNRVSQVADQAQQKAADLKDRAADVASQAKESLAETFDRTKENVGRTYDEASRRTADFMRNARARSRYIMDEYPIQVIAGAAAVGFLIGVGLRIWRSSRYE